MGLFAFRRLREREAASTEVAFFSTPEPAKIEPTLEPDNGDRPSRNSRRKHIKHLPDAG